MIEVAGRAGFKRWNVNVDNSHHIFKRERPGGEVDELKYLLMGYQQPLQATRRTYCMWCPVWLFSCVAGVHHGHAGHASHYAIQADNILFHGAHITPTFIR